MVHSRSRIERMAGTVSATQTMLVPVLCARSIPGFRFVPGTQCHLAPHKAAKRAGLTPAALHGKLVTADLAPKVVIHASMHCHCPGAKQLFHHGLMPFPTLGKSAWHAVNQVYHTLVQSALAYFCLQAASRRKQSIM
jgi:hypothetical protein